jgi:type IV pilus assembly protein PilA
MYKVIKGILERRDQDEGFTLIELMVVVLIIAILIAIAIPTFLGARESAQNSAAVANIRTALAAEKLYFTTNFAYADVTDPDQLANLQRIENSLQYQAGTSGASLPIGASEVAIDTPSPSTVYITARASDTLCYTVRVVDDTADPNAGTRWGTSDCSGLPTTWETQPNLNPNAAGTP